MCYFGIFWLDVDKCLALFDITNFEVALLLKVQKKIKMLKFGKINALFSYFWAGILKCFDISNQYPQICQNAKICEKVKKSKFGSKNGLLGFFLLSWYYFTTIHKLQDYTRMRSTFILNSNYHFHPPQRYLAISLAITKEYPPLRIGSSCTWTRNLWFQSQVANN